MNASHSWTDYQARLARVVAYVHDRLDEPLDLNNPRDTAPADLLTDIYLPLLA